MPPPSHVREYPVIECDLEFVELTRLGAPLEVFCADPSELPSVGGRTTPEHGAFVARVLSRRETSGGLPHDWNGGGFTRVWRRDPEGGAVVVPAPRVGTLRDHVDDLVALSDDWFVLGLRFEADAEIRQSFNLHGFTSVARRHLRIFVVPSLDEGIGVARVIVTAGGEHSPLAHVARSTPGPFHADEPPALDMIRAYVEGPTAPAFPGTREGVDDRSEVAGSSPRFDDAERFSRTADGLFPHQARTVRWMAAVERGGGCRHGGGADDDSRALTSPVLFAGRVMHPDGLEHSEKETERDARRRLRLAREGGSGADLEKGSGADFSSLSPSPARLYRGPYADIGDALARAAAGAAAAGADDDGEVDGDDFDSPATGKDAPRLPRGGLVAHPVGAGKTVIAAAHCARAKRDDDDDERDDFDRDDFDGNTLVVCPNHVASQWLDALREFAPNLRCRRADSYLNAGDPSGLTPERSFDPRVRDTRPVHDPKAWDVLVCSHEDVPEVFVVNERCAKEVAASGVSSGVSSGGGRADDDERRAPRREHPLWDYDVPRFSVVDGGGNEGKEDKGKEDKGKEDGKNTDEARDSARVSLRPRVKNSRWRRLIVDEPQELSFAWRVGRRSGGGAWLTEVIAAGHRWALTATPGAGAGDASGGGVRDVCSLTFGKMLTRREYRKVRARWHERRCVRDPPNACLPVPPVTYRSVPVTLTWHEASVVQLYGESFDATFHDVISLCSGFGVDVLHLNGENGENRIPGVDGSVPDGIEGSFSRETSTAYESMEQWAARHTESHELALRRLERKRDSLLRELKRSDSRYEADLAAKGGINPFEHLDDLMTEESLADRPAWEEVATDDAAWDGGGGALDLRKMRAALAEESAVSAAGESANRLEYAASDSEQSSADESYEDDDDLDDPATSGSRRRPDPRYPADNTLDVTLAIRKDLDAVNHALDRSRRALAFVDAAAARLRDSTAECAVCFERLAGRHVTVLRCLHHFDGQCVARMLAASSARGGGGASARTVTCPLCRVPTRRKNMCTFVHGSFTRDGDGDEKSAPGDEKSAPGDEKSAPGDDGDETERWARGNSGARSNGAGGGSKPAALADLLNGILSNDPDDKVVVYAQRPDTVAAIAARVEAAVAARLPQTSTASTTSTPRSSEGPAGPAATAGSQNQNQNQNQNESRGGAPVVVTLLGSASARAAAVEAFQSPDASTSPRVMCLAFDSHASGLNLHRANHVVITHPFAAKSVCPGAPDLTPLSSAASYERQAVGRIARYPQHKTCHAYRMFAVGTVEEELYAAWGLI